MNNGHKISVKPYTNRKIGPDDLVTLKGHKLRFSKRYPRGIVFRAANQNQAGKPIPIKWEDLWRADEAGQLEVEPGYFTDKNAIADDYGDAGHQLQPETVMRAKMVSEFIAQREDTDDNLDYERCGKSEEGITRFQAMFIERNPELVEEARASLAAKGKKKLFVEWRQFCRLIDKFEESEQNVQSLADNYPGGGSPGSTFEHEDLTKALEYAATARTPDRPTVVSAHRAMVADNRKLLAAGKPGYRVPSLTTFQRLVNEGCDFVNDVGSHETKHRVERKFFFKQQGLEVTRPLQIVEMDEHLVHLMTMFTKNGLWDRFHPDVRVRIEKLGRVWLSVALDAYSRSVVGMKVSKDAPNAELAVATLAMVAQRKDKLSLLLRATTKWPQCGTPEAIHTDAGAGYVAAKFELAVMMFTGKHRIPPSKHPHLRGRIERFFRTLNQRYIHLFSGQTFSNPFFKEDYDASKFVHITDEEFADMIGRLIVDCYHNTKHSQLGMTPLEAWYRGSQLANGAVAKEPSPRKYREIFGATIKRSIGNDGIKIAGNIYSSVGLLDYRKKWYRAKLLVRVNEEDLWSISVKHKNRNAWIEVPAVYDGLKGVTLDEWQEVIRRIARRFGTNVEHSQQIVDETLLETKGTIALSKERPGILVHRSIEKKLADIEAAIPANFRYSQQPEYDYGAYDDGIDHDDDPEDVEDDINDATARMGSAIDEPKLRVTELQPIAPGGSAFNPGGRAQTFDRSRFAERDAQALPAQSKTASNSRPKTKPKAAQIAEPGASSSGSASAAKIRGNAPTRTSSPVRIQRPSKEK